MDYSPNCLSNGNANVDKQHSDDDADEVNMQDFIHKLVARRLNLNRLAE